MASKRSPKSKPIPSRPTHKQILATVYEGAQKGWTIPQVAMAVGVSRNTIRNHMHKAKVSWTALVKSFNIPPPSATPSKSSTSPKTSTQAVIQTPAAPQTAAQMLAAAKAVKSQQEIIDELVELAPDRLRPLFRTLVIDYFNDRVSWRWKAITDFLKDVKQFENADVVEIIIPYMRPDWLAPKQTEIANIILALEKHISIDGDRQTGKDSASAVGVFEDCIQRPTTWFFMASKKDTAIQIMKKILKEKRFEYILPHINSQYTEHIIFKTQTGGYSHIWIVDTTEAAVMGITGNLWMDDIDTILKNQLGDVITKAIMISRANTELRIIFTSNMGKGSYQILMSAFKKHKEMIDCIQLTKDDVPHINQMTDEFLYDVATAVSGKAMADAQLLHKYSATGDTFDPATLSAAMDTYEIFSHNRPNRATPGAGLGVDPSGTGHPWGWFAGCWGNETVWELESGEFQMGEYDEDTNEKWTMEHITAFFADTCVRLLLRWVVIENNSSGPALASMLRIRLRKIGYPIPVLLVTWGGDTASDSRASHIGIARDFFDELAIHICGDVFFTKLTIYNPDIAKLKGDVVDAFLHFLWHTVGGLKWLKRKEEKTIRHETTETDSSKRSPGLYL